jgi:hypothetical protein
LDPHCSMRRYGSVEVIEKRDCVERSRSEVVLRLTIFEQP